MTSFIVFGLNQPENQAQKPFKEGTRTRNKIFILFALIIILIIILSLAGFLFFKKSTNKDQSCQNFQDKKNSNPLNQSPPTGQTIAKKVDESDVSSLTKDDIKNLQLYSLIRIAPWMTSNQIDNIDNDKLVPLILQINTNEKNPSRKKGFIEKLSSDKISKMGTEDLDQIIPSLCESFQGGEYFFKQLTPNQIDSITISNLVQITNYLSKLSIEVLSRDNRPLTPLFLEALQRKGKNTKDLTSILSNIDYILNKQRFIQKLDQNQIQLLGENPVVLINVMSLMSTEQLHWIKGKEKGFNSLIETAISMNKLSSVFTRYFVEILSQEEVQSIDNKFVPKILQAISGDGYLNEDKTKFLEKLSEDQQDFLEDFLANPSFGL